MCLGDYLASAGRTLWRDGEHDCCTFPAGWVMLCGHPDPMARWRGTYADADGAQAIVGAQGGLVPLWEQGLSGVRRVDGEAFEAGDVGVVRVLGIDGPVESGAVFAGRRWALLAPRGLLVTLIEPADVLAVWRPCLRP